MNGHIYAAIVGAAMELSLFWQLADEPRSAVELSRTLGIPLNRCHYWLEILSRLGLLDKSGEDFSPSAIARESILNIQDQETWSFQAREDRDLSLYVRDLPSDIQKPISDWRLSDLAPIEYFRQIAADPAYMAAFTRKLYQIHRSLAQKLADLLDLQGARRLLDLGGGSGVISFALLRKYGQLSAVVVDLDSVCRVGRQIARENQLAGRVSYRPADFLKDDLPGGFDVVMLCDVGRFDEALFHKIHHVLDQNGRLVIVDKFALGEASAPPSRLLATFLGSLESPAQAVDYITAEVLQNRLHQAGFRDFSTRLVPHLDDLPWNMDWTVIEVHK